MPVFRPDLRCGSLAATSAQMDALLGQGLVELEARERACKEREDMLERLIQEAADDDDDGGDNPADITGALTPATAQPAASPTSAPASGSSQQNVPAGRVGLAGDLHPVSLPAGTTAAPATHGTHAVSPVGSPALSSRPPPRSPVALRPPPPPRATSAPSPTPSPPPPVRRL